MTRNNEPLHGGGSGGGGGGGSGGGGSGGGGSGGRLLIDVRTDSR